MLSTRNFRASLRLTTRQLRARILRLLGRETRQSVTLPQPIRRERAYAPQLRPLEARFVLNATAELNALGQLVIMGDAANDVVTMQVNSQDELTLQDGAGAAIGIDGQSGSPTDPLSVTEITSGQILIDMGSGDDTLNLELPAGIDVSVVDGAGNDSVDLTFSPSGGDGSLSNVIDVEAESITVDLASPAINFLDNEVRLTGDVVLGSAATNARIDIGSGVFAVDGSITLAGNLLIEGTGTLDWSAATLTSSIPGADLLVALSDPMTSSVVVGGIDNSGGGTIDDFNVISAGSFATTTDQISVDGDFIVRGIESTATINAPIQADSIRISSDGDLRFTGSIVSGTNAQNVSFISAANIDIDVPVSSVQNLTISAGGQANLGDQISVQNDLMLRAVDGIRVDAEQLMANRLSVLSDVIFLSDTQVVADTIRFNGMITTQRRPILGSRSMVSSLIRSRAQTS